MINTHPSLLSDSFGILEQTKSEPCNVYWHTLMMLFSYYTHKGVNMDRRVLIVLILIQGIAALARHDQEPNLGKNIKKGIAFNYMCSL